MPPTDPAPQTPSDRSRIIRATAIVSMAFIASRLLGVIRDAVINYYFDIDSLEANAYFVAIGFPDTIYYIIAGGALGSAFIPTFAGYFTRDDEGGGWRLFSAICNLVTVTTTLAAALAALFAPQIITFFYPDLVAREAGLLALSVDLMRVMLLSPIIFGVSGVIMGALNARQHFLLPALAPIVYNAGIIAGTVVLAPNVMGLAVGTVGGALGHLLIQLPGLRRHGARYQLTFSLDDPGVRQVLRLMAPRVLGLSFGQLNHLITRFLAQSLILGSIGALAFAWRIMIMPQGIIGQALGIASFPTFATLAARSAMKEMRRILADTLRLILFVSLPATVLLLVLRRPVVSLLFERGAFDAQSTDFVAWALFLYSFSLVGLAAIEIVARAFYALEDTVTPVLVGALQLLAMALIGLGLSRGVFPMLDESAFLGRSWPAFGGLALGYSISTVVELALLLWLLRRKMKGLDGYHLLDGLWRMGLAALLMLVGTWLTFQQTGNLIPLWQLVLATALGAVLYLLACLILHVQELQQFLDAGRRRLKTKRPG